MDIGNTLIQHMISENTYLSEHHLCLDYASTYSLEDSGSVPLIGQKLQQKLLRAVFPYEDSESGMYFDFPELHQMTFDKSYAIDTPLVGQALLFSGERGCGKHTLQNAFIGDIFRIIRDGLEDESKSTSEIFYYFRMDALSDDLDTKQERQIYLEKLFDMFDETVKDEWAQEKMILISLGDVTQILDHRSSAKIFVKRLSKLMSQNNVLFFITAIYDGTADKIKDLYKKPFLVCEVTEPTGEDRIEFFRRMFTKYRKIGTDFTYDELAKKTEEFTYAMLEDLKKMMLLYVKTEVLESDLHYKDFVNNSNTIPNEKIILSGDSLNLMIETIRRIRYKKHVKKLLYGTNEAQLFSIGQNVTQYAYNNDIAKSDNDDNSEKVLNKYDHEKPEEETSKSIDEQAKDIVDNMESRQEMDDFFCNLGVSFTSEYSLPKPEGKEELNE